MKRTLMLVPLLLPLFAYADNGARMLAAAPPAYQAECGSCHLAFPPGLMSANDWRQVMQRLDKHYGDNASLDAKTAAEIEAFLIRYAGSDWNYGGAAPAQAGEPPRLTRTPWFVRKHREVSRADWNHPKVKSPANCAACHTRAAEGSFNEHEVVLPSGGRGEGGREGGWREGGKRWKGWGWKGWRGDGDDD